MCFYRIRFNSPDMTKLFFALTILTIFTSCYHVNESEIIVPDVLLSESQLVEILTEVQIVESGLGISKNRNKSDKLKPEYYSKILQQYGISVQQLKENLDYYQNYPKVLEEIYDRVLANLSKMQSEVLEEMKKIEEKRIADSISMVNDSLDILRMDTLVKTYN